MNFTGLLGSEPPLLFVFIASRILLMSARTTLPAAFSTVKFVTCDTTFLRFELFYTPLPNPTAWYVKFLSRTVEPLLAKNLTVKPVPETLVIVK